ncbi:MAG: polysaccharide pyruvyl transferase family protein [Chloroflexota bacterium]|nr:polysaccharide pyruvyl transferase family protein [Chloroflexota bacterium]
MPYTSSPKIGLFGPYGYGNLGDAAIQTAMIQNIRQRFPQAQIVGFSLNPPDTEQRHKIPAYPITRPPDRDWLDPEGAEPVQNPLHRFARWLHYHPNPHLRRVERILVRMPLELLLVQRSLAVLKDFDYLIISGGGQLDDYWGGAWSHPYALLKWSILAKVRGAKLLFVSIGAGPITAQLSRLFCRRALTLADYRSYRDGDSKAYMAQLGFQGDDPVYPDLAYSLQVEDESPVQRRRLAHPVVGVGPIAYFDPRVWPQRNSEIYWGYLHKLAAFTQWLIAHAYTVRFFPGDFHYDGLVIEDLIGLLRAGKTPATTDSIIYERVCTVEALLQQLRATDMVVTSRFHGVLLAHLLQKPVVALSYHPKVDTLMAAAGQSAYTLPIDRFDVATLIACFQRLEAEQANAVVQIKQKTAESIAALKEQYARLFSHG